MRASGRSAPPGVRAQAWACLRAFFCGPGKASRRWRWMRPALMASFDILGFGPGFLLLYESAAKPGHQLFCVRISIDNS